MAILNQTARRRATRLQHVLLVMLLAVGLKLSAQTAATKEYQIKAAFLFNFAQFIEWPADALTNTDVPFRIGILGDDPFGTALEDTVQGETIHSHKIIVQRSREIGDLKNCQLIFIDKSEKNRVADVLSELDSKPTVTVSEIDGFARNGGVINFYLEEKKVRFEINPVAAQNDGLKISSQLLSLGKIVQPARGGK
jgi:hypothetical protein